MSKDKEVLKILREEAKKEVKKDSGKSTVSEEVIKENIEKKGKVWEKDSEEKEDKSST